MAWTYRQTLGYLDVEIWSEMNATMLPEIIAMTAVEYKEKRNVSVEVETSQQWKAILLLDKIVSGTKSGEILDPLKVGSEYWV